MKRILLHGSGRMARRVLALAPEASQFECIGWVSKSRPDAHAGIEWHPSLDDVRARPDLVIDFTLPGGTALAARWCEQHRVALLSGTTGLGAEDTGALESAAREVPVLWAPNLSKGVAVVSALVRQAAAALGPEPRVAIADRHHRHKLDAPSGTALALGDAVKFGYQQGSANASSAEQHEPEYSSVREGEVIGEHTVSFTLPDELIEITHKALDRDVFARGALEAGAWLLGQAAGLYSTGDWLGLD